mgnify:CR=1 FL=1
MSRDRGPQQAPALMPTIGAGEQAKSEAELAKGRVAAKGALGKTTARSEDAYNKLMDRMFGLEKTYAKTTEVFQKAKGAVEKGYGAGKTAMERQIGKGLQAAQVGGGFGRGAMGAQLRDTQTAQSQQLANFLAQMGIDLSKLDLGQQQAMMAGAKELFGTQSAVGEAGVAAGAQAYEEQKELAKIGTETQVKQQKQADYQDKVNKIIAANKNVGFLGLDDDEEAMKTQILALAANEGDQQIKAWLTATAHDIRSGRWNV